ncbi:MAG: single-stranded DNA-binding protein [Legionellales bacterium]|jgi:single-strand DNA-binding protein
MNNISLIGRLCHSIEVKTTPNGKSVGNFTLAVDRQFKNTAGEKESDFINCQAWGSQADFLKDYSEKGNRIGVTGRLQIRKYDDKDGNKRTAAEVICASVERLEESKQKDAQPDTQERPASKLTDLLPEYDDSIVDPFG